MELTEADHVEAYVGYAKGKNQIRGLQVLAAVLLFGVAFGVLMTGPVRPGVWAALAAILAAAIPLARYQWTWIGKRAFAALPEVRRAYEVCLGDDVREHGARAEIRYSWRSLAGWIETANLIVVHGRGGVAGFWTKRSFADTQLDALRRLLDERIPKPEPADPKARAAEAKKRRKKTLLLWGLLVLMFVAIYQLVAETG